MERAHTKHGRASCPLCVPARHSSARLCMRCPPAACRVPNGIGAVLAAFTLVSCEKERVNISHGAPAAWKGMQLAPAATANHWAAPGTRLTAARPQHALGPPARASFPVRLVAPLLSPSSYTHVQVLIWIFPSKAKGSPPSSDSEAPLGGGIGQDASESTTTCTSQRRLAEPGGGAAPDRRQAAASVGGSEGSPGQERV